MSQQEDAIHRVSTRGDGELISEACYLCEVFLKFIGNIKAIYAAWKRCFSFTLLLLKSC